MNESRVSQLHARAVQRLRKELGPDLNPGAPAAATAGGNGTGRGRRRLNMAKARVPAAAARRSSAA